MDYTYQENFKYKHKNPYHDKLENFSNFVLRDDEGESFRGLWKEKVFQSNGPLVVEVGSGYGHFMVDYCSKNPEVNFVGMDYRFKRSYNLAKKLENQTTKNNFRYLRARGERIGFTFNESEVDKVFYFFPDPWPKARHNKRRLFQPPFLDSVHKVLKHGGEFFIKTDHDDYAQWMAEFIENDSRFEIVMKTNDLWAEHEGHFLTSFMTKFEKIFISKSKNINAFVLRNLKS